MRAVRVTVRGKVQRVGFRWHTTKAAGRLGVVGWVRNDPDTSVAVHVEGDEPSVEAMLEWLGTGPATARVDAVEIVETDPIGAEAFEVRPRNTRV
jgi:acylphosphatase